MLRQIVLRDATAGDWLIFATPLDVLVAWNTADVIGVLSAAERRVQDERLFAAGFVSYEAAPAFDAANVIRPAGALPLICFGLFRAPERVAELPSAGIAAPHIEWNFSAPRDDYLERIAAIKQQIAAGNTYQVNYTVRQQANDVTNAWHLFLSAAQDAPYAAWIDSSEHAIASASPELFFELDGNRIVCKPMKGTAPRGMTADEDRRKRRWLSESAKDRAENVMIVDMVRNDLGRVALPGSVRADALFDIEKYRTVWQMTSTVTAFTNHSVTEIFQALFPSASVTGAPKVSSMKMIAALEGSPRQVYTGAIGFIAPGRKARFSVAIRTALIDTSTGSGTYGVGGGIVWDSDPEAEFQECRNKARVLDTPVPAKDFRLFETILWTDDGFFLLNEHLDRLADSAEYFDFVFDRSRVNEHLAELTQRLASGKHRIRLLLRRTGEINTETRPASRDDTACEFRLALAAEPVDARNPFLYHKTTQRDIYEDALSTAGNCDDVLLWNRDGDITESTIGNVVVRIDGQLFTPPVGCGLLAGTFRRKLLLDGVLQERKIAVDELPRAEAIFLINSVRGWIPCRLQQRDLEAKRLIRT